MDENELFFEVERINFGQGRPWLNFHRTKVQENGMVITNSSLIV